jgi:acyl-coenzyme A synthetase/AMP-(fatty) acid ligase
MVLLSRRNRHLCAFTHPLAAAIGTRIACKCAAEMEWITWTSLLVLLFGLWVCTAQLSKSFPTLQGKRICLLIAHPDDEAMFFAPMLLALTRPELRNHLEILCLSSGALFRSRWSCGLTSMVCRQCGWAWGNTEEGACQERLAPGAARRGRRPCG